MNMKKKWVLPMVTSFMIFSGVTATEVEAATASDLTKTAYQYIGAPYKYGGTSVSSGIDCSAFTQFIFNKFGVSLSRTSRGQYSQGVAVSKSNLKVGDLVFFNTSGSGVSHVGIYIGNNQFISATTSGGVAVDSIYDPYYWGKRYVGAKRVANFSTEEASQVKSEAIDYSVYPSRGDVAIKLAETLNLDTSNTNAPFPDVKSTDKYAGAVTALNKIGVFIGDDQGKFNPKSPITRAEIASVLVKAFDLKLQGTAKSFSDVPKNHWANEVVSILSSNGVTIGIGNGKYGVNQYLKYDQLSLFIERALNKVN